MSELHDYELADTLEAERLRRRPSHGWFRCPTHGYRIRTRDGHLLGRCSGCAGEAANGIRDLKTKAGNSHR